MSDLIRREDVLALLDSIYTEIENHFPSEESERKKGNWLDTGCKKIYKCSECGNYLDFDGVNAGRGDVNFCPNCGAEMKGEYE